MATLPPGVTVAGEPEPPAGGVTARTNGTVVTVSKVDPTMFAPPCAIVAVMVEVSPPVKPVARPAAVMEAASVFEEAQVTVVVMFCVL
jgi:hypothetical protein